MKTDAYAIVDALAGDLLDLSHDLHAHPETAFREERSSRRIAALSSARGLPVRLGVGGLPTAFAGVAGRGPQVVILCEYDSLPELGHACGHNVIAASSLGAALALSRLGVGVRLVGTPAEENMHGGKVILARAGLFDDALAAMMVHPASYDVAAPTVIAAAAYRVTAHGRAAHAAMFPERGVNALDGIVLGYSAMTALRAHLPYGARTTAVIRYGGSSPNVVPERATADVQARHPTRRGLPSVRDRVLSCYRHGASAVGATLSVEPIGEAYDDLVPYPALAAAYAANASALGRHLVGPQGGGGATDVGNVSRLLPTIQPHIAIAPPEIASHSPEFAVAAASPAADRAVLDGAKALAATAIDVWRTRVGGYW